MPPIFLQFSFPPSPMVMQQLDCLNGSLPKPSLSKQDLELSQLDQEPSGLGANWRYSHSEIMEDSEVEASVSHLEKLGLADPVTRPGSKCRKVKPPFTFTYENGSWVLFQSNQSSL